MSPCRVKRDILAMLSHPPDGFYCRTKFEDTLFEIILYGEDDTAYENGVFVMELNIPPQYPINAPTLQFMTPIYHPNVDIVGRICLDMLMGCWTPSDTLCNLLTSVKNLIYNPNVDAPLMPDRAIKYKFQIDEFKRQAREWTLQFALNTNSNYLKPPVDFSRKRQFELEEAMYGSNQKRCTAIDL